jgi:hypothetical protein
VKREMKNLIASAAITCCTAIPAAALSNYDNLVAHCATAIGILALEEGHSSTYAVNDAQRYIMNMGADPIDAMGQVVTAMRRLNSLERQGRAGDVQQMYLTMMRSCDTLVKHNR